MEARHRRSLYHTERPTPSRIERACIPNFAGLVGPLSCAGQTRKVDKYEDSRACFVHAGATCQAPTWRTHATFLILRPWHRDVCVDCNPRRGASSGAAASRSIARAMEKLTGALRNLMVVSMESDHVIMESLSGQSISCAWNAPKKSTTFRLSRHEMRSMSSNTKAATNLRGPVVCPRPRRRGSPPMHPRRSLRPRVQRGADPMATFLGILPSARWARGPP
mmetsp:Transcript_7557/g.27735  ORF Transcript_7557/g.27735 Transcript_7557/m.27735 type:complete len:221 (+) Transcript_7557:272-934(+)